MHLKRLSILLLQALSVSAAKLAVSLPSTHSAALAGSSIGTSAVLHSSPPVRAPLEQWGGFTFDLDAVAATQNGTDAQYLLDVNSKQYLFAPMLIAVDKSGELTGAWLVKRGEKWGENGEGMKTVEIHGKGAGDVRSVTARLVVQKNFYEQRTGFSPLSLFKNPMIILAVVALGITFGMPYLMENMDPETRAEFEQAQKQGGLATLMGGGAAGGDRSSDRPPPPNPANFDLAGWMAGQTIGKSETTTSGSDVRSGGTRRRG